jgi:protein pelota
VSTDASGSTVSSRVLTDITVAVINTSYDAAASTLSITGKTVENNPHVARGSFHTLDLELSRKFSLSKESGWDSVTLEMLKEAIDSSGNIILWAVLLDIGSGGKGKASIYSMTDHTTNERANVSTLIPGKAAKNADQTKAMDTYYETIFRSLTQQLTAFAPTSAKKAGESAPPIVLASPGFAARKFERWLQSRPDAKSDKTLLGIIERVMVAHSSATSPSALKEALADPAVKAKLENKRFAKESQLVDKLYELIRLDNGRGWYGEREVRACMARGAISGGATLLISNKLFRSTNPKDRRKYVEMVDEARKAGAEVKVLSEVHQSGMRLDALSGIAAILTYPIHELEELDSDDDG